MATAGGGMLDFLTSYYILFLGCWNIQLLRAFTEWMWGQGKLL